LRYWAFVSLVDIWPGNPEQRATRIVRDRRVG
jgi:hypothetical protein